jgi:hypothetical protein
VEVGVRAEVAAGRGGEDVSLVLPVGSGLDPLLVLLLLVLAEELDQRVGEADGAASGAGLGGVVLAAGLLFLGAVASFPAARVVAAAVGVLGAETVLADADVARVQVDVFPVEPECFPLAETERQDDPPRAVAEPGGLDEETLNLLDRERLYVLFFETRRLGDLGSRTVERRTTAAMATEMAVTATAARSAVRTTPPTTRATTVF